MRQPDDYKIEQYLKNIVRKEDRQNLVDDWFLTLHEMSQAGLNIAELHFNLQIATKISGLTIPEFNKAGEITGRNKGTDWVLTEQALKSKEQKSVPVTPNGAL